MEEQLNRRQDKIFDNSYNAGTLDDIYDTPIVLNESYKKSYLFKEYNVDEDHRHTKLLDYLYDQLQDSEYKDMFNDAGASKKRILKNSISELLSFILPLLDDKLEYTFAEKFKAISDVLDIKDSTIWEHLPIAYKDIALQELSNYTQIKNRQQTTRLF